MEMMFSVAEVGGAAVAPDGARVDIELIGAEDERLILRLPVELAPDLVLLLCGAAGSAQRDGHRIQHMMHADRIVLHPGPDFPAFAVLTIVAEGGLNIQVRCPADRIGAA